MTQEMMAITDLASKMTRIEVTQDTQTKAIADLASGINRLVDKLDNSDDIAREALQSAKSAHHRIEELKTVVTNLEMRMHTKFANQDSSARWRITTSLSIGGAVIAAVSFAINYFVN